LILVSKKEVKNQRFRQPESAMVLALHSFLQYIFVPTNHKSIEE